MNLDDQMKIEEDEEDIALANFIDSLQKQTDEKFFSKNVTEWLRYRIYRKEKLRISFLK